MSAVLAENHMPEPTRQPRVRLLLLLIPEPLLRSIDITTMTDPECPHASIPIGMHANYPVLARIASIGTGVSPLKHGVHTRMRYDASNGTLAPRRSEDTGAPWVWDLVRRHGRSATTIDWPLINNPDGEHCLSVLGPNPAGEALQSEDLVPTIERHLDVDLLTVAMNLHLRVDGAAQGIDPETARDAVETLIERLRPEADEDHLLVYISTRTFDHLLCFGRRADAVTKKSASQSDVPATVLDLLELDRTADIPGRSVLEAFDDEQELWHWPALNESDGTADPIEAAIESVLGGDRTATTHVVNWLTSAWICNARYRGITSVELRYAQLLHDLRGDAQDMFRLASSADLVDDRKTFEAVHEALQREHTGTVQELLVGTMTAAEPTIEQLRATVESLDPATMLPAQVRVWCDAAIRAGLHERAVEQLEPLVRHGQSLPKDRLTLADHYMKHDAPGKALRALGLIGTNPALQPQLAVHRARILIACDLVDAAKRLLEAVLESSPMDPGARPLLDTLEPRSNH